MVRTLVLATQTNVAVDVDFGSFGTNYVVGDVASIEARRSFKR